MRYAQSILELFNQVHRDGYDKSDLQLLRDTYALAVRAFTGLIRPSGKLFIAHCVGTASVLHCAGAPPCITCAGLLHSAYMHGGLAGWGAGAPKAARSEVRTLLGAEVEGLVARYATFEWNRRTIPTICRALQAYDTVGKGVVLMRLANEVDENLDGGVLYLANLERKRETDRPIVPLLVEMARQLGYGSLGRELAVVFEQTLSARTPDSKPQGLQRLVSLQVPRSCRRSFGSHLAEHTLRALRLIRDRI